MFAMLPATVSATIAIAATRATSAVAAATRSSPEGPRTCVLVDVMWDPPAEGCHRSPNSARYAATAASIVGKKCLGSIVRVSS